MTIVNDEEFDVVVLGSGAAGLSAALSARAQGARVCLLEKASHFGGTSSMSGGVIWAPDNPLMDEVGSSDSREAALTYLECLSLDRTERVLLEAFVDNSRKVIEFLQAETPLELHALSVPDYHPEFPGATHGRSIIPDAFDAKQLGDLRPKLRMSPHFTIPVSLLDMERVGGVVSMSNDEDGILGSGMLAERMQNDIVASGTALVAGLLKAAMDKGVVLRSEARASSLIIEDGVVAGVSVEWGGRTQRIGTRKGVVIASGGYEHNAQLVRDFIRGPLHFPAGAPSNQGDGLVMAMEAGAAIGNMSEAWWIPVLQIPGEEYEGKPFYRFTTIERSMPGAIMVNRKGRRFVNEAHNYNDIGRAFHTFDPVAFEFENHPAWIVLHQGRLDRYAFLTRFPGDPLPDWLISASTIRELANKIEVDPDTLEETVERFNANAKAGVDPDFRRGESVYDHYHADPSREGAWKSLGPLDEPPFYAMPVYAGALGTKGGPRTNEKAEVLNLRGGIIPGLYAAGNAMAGVTGMAYPGAGGTLGPALIYGHIAGRSAAARNNRF